MMIFDGIMNVTGFTAGSHAYAADSIAVTDELFADDGSLYVSSQHREDRLSTLLTLALVNNTNASEIKTNSPEIADRKKVKVKADIALHGNPISKLRDRRDVTCHIGYLFIVLTYFQFQTGVCFSCLFVSMHNFCLFNFYLILYGASELRMGAP